MAGIQTQTLAEVYAGQGHFAEACSIYEALVAASPADDALLTRLGELRTSLSRQEDTDARRDQINRLKVLLKRVRARRVRP